MHNDIHVFMVGSEPTLSPLWGPVYYGQKILNESHNSVKYRF